MTMSLAPVIKHKFTDANDLPLSGGKVYTYQSGTSTPQATYTDSGGLSANTNPVILDAAGQCNLWLDQTLSYKFVLKDSNDVTQWTVDNIIGLLTNNAVATASLQDGSVTTAKLADDAVDATKLKDDASIDANRAVNTNHIRDSAVTRNKLATGAVGKYTVNTYTATQIIPITDDFVRMDVSLGAWSATMPTAISNTGRQITVYKIGTDFNVGTIAANGAETVGGFSTVSIVTPGETWVFVSDGSNWIAKDHKTISNWASYTPALTGSTTNPTLGSGGSFAQQGSWRRVGDSIDVIIGLRFGTAGVSAGSGTYRFGLPNSWTIDASSKTKTANNAMLGTATIRDDSALVRYYGEVAVSDGVSYVTVQEVSNGNLVTDTVPMTWAANDIIDLKFTVPITGWKA